MELRSSDTNPNTPSATSSATADEDDDGDEDDAKPLQFGSLLKKWSFAAES
jgi:hypothetical protein